MASKWVKQHNRLEDRSIGISNSFHRPSFGQHLLHDPSFFTTIDFPGCYCLLRLQRQLHRTLVNDAEICWDTWVILSRLAHVFLGTPSQGMDKNTLWLFRHMAPNPQTNQLGLQICTPDAAPFQHTNLTIDHRSAVSTRFEKGEFRSFAKGGGGNTKTQPSPNHLYRQQVILRRCTSELTLTA